MISQLLVADLQCHVMQEEKDDTESYGIIETARILNEFYVLVKFENNIHYVTKILEIVNP